VSGRRKPAASNRKRRAPKFEDTGHTRDFCQIAFDYATEAVADKKGKRHGKWLRLAAARFLKDLKRAGGKRPPFTFSPWHANDPCDFIERLPHIEGTWATPTIVMHPSHVFFVVQLFGFRNQKGQRRFTSALFNVARKNAKSTLAAGILLYCLCCEDDPGAQVISAATTYDQSAIIFKVAKAMATKNHELREYFGLECFSKAIARYETGASFKAIHAKASTQDGLNPSYTALDEIHAHKTPEMVNVLRSAAGARESPLWLYTTTEGYINPGPWGEMRKFARQLLQGVFGTNGDYYLAVIYAVDDDDDEFDEAAWPKANPLWDVNHILRDEVHKAATEAKAMPSQLAEFRIKRLNRQSASAESCIDIPKWKRCGGQVDLAALEGAACWAGLDLASTTDIAAWRLLWLLDGRWYTWGRNWVPADMVRERTERNTAPYGGWVEAGWITQTDGNVIDYDVVEAEILQDWERFQPRQIAYDSWNAAATANRLTEAGVEMVQFIQGGKSYNPAFKALERAYRSGNLSHGNDPVLLWAASNLVPRYDGNMNMAPDKKRSAEKIDPVCALMMAFGIAEADIEEDLSGFFNSPVHG
jgi:phage terminase large subunit-like protein